MFETNLAPTGSDTCLCPKNSTKGNSVQDLTVTYTLFAATPTNTNFSSQKGTEVL